MKIGIDLDDVVVDTLPSFVKFYNKRYGTSFRREDVTSYHIWEVGFGKTKQEAVKLFDEFYESPEFDDMSLVEGAHKGVLELARLSDCRLPIVTSRPLLYKPKTDSLIARTFHEISLPVYHAKDFHYGVNHTKAEICQSLKLDYYIEDCLAYAEDCAERGIHVFLLDKPWNQNDSLHPLITKVNNWQEILQHIKRSESNAPLT